jgi:type IV secretory pathway VirB4 component
MKAITPAPNANGWNNSAVTISFQCRGCEGAAAMVGDLGEAQQELEVSGHHFGQFSTTIVIYGRDLGEVRQTSAECYKIFAAKGAHLRRLWLSS